MRIDHVQIAAPEGCERAAREFYGRTLGLTEIEKPVALRARGGCWFQCGEHQLHIGVEKNFRAAKKAHLALTVENLDALRETLRRHKYPVIDYESIPHIRRFYSEDPWGNRLEFVDARK